MNSQEEPVDFLTFIRQNTILVGGAGLFCLSLLAACTAFMFMGVLKIKHIKLRKRLRKRRRTGERKGKPGG